MRLALKVAVVLVPVLAVVGLLRLCEGESGRRLLAEVHGIDPELVLGVDTPELIAIGPDATLAERMGNLALRTKEDLAGEYGDLLGTGLDRRMVVVVFRDVKHVGEFGGKGVRIDRRSLKDVIGLTQPARNAIYLPPGEDVSTLRHEVVHLLMSQSASPDARFSPWLSEGLAQYFEAYAGGRHRLSPGQKAFLATALGKRPFDVTALIRKQDYDEFLQEDGQRNYLQALALVAYLMEAHPRERMREYVGEEKRTSGDRETLFRRIFGDPAAMDVLGYLRS